MRLIKALRHRRPSDGFWLIVSLMILAGLVALPAAAWTGMEAAAYGSRE